MRGPEVIAAAIGYVASSLGFEFDIPVPKPGEAPLHHVESTLVGIGGAIVATGLTMGARRINRNRSEENT
jgi:hypothetical protein